MEGNFFAELPRDVLRLIVDSLPPEEYFRLRKAVALDHVLKRYLLVSASEWSELIRKYMAVSDLLQFVRTNPPTDARNRLVDFLDSFRIDPRPLSRRNVYDWILKLGDFIARDRVLAHIDYTGYPLDRIDCCGTSFFAWKSIAPYIEILGTYVLKSPTLSPRRVADYIVMSAIIKNDVMLMRVFLVQFWYRKLRGDILIAAAIACESWDCLRELFERYTTKETPLRIISNFQTGIKSEIMVDLLLRSMDTAGLVFPVSPTVLASILMYYSKSKKILKHKLWESLTDEKISQTFECIVTSKNESTRVMNPVKFLLSLPNANHKKNSLYLSAAIVSGNAALIKHLIKVGHAECSREWIYTCCEGEHSPAKCRRIIKLLGFQIDDTY